jgi:hypothetical protein
MAAPHIEKEEEKSMRRIAVLIMAVLAIAAAAEAQVVNPRAIRFNSPDHTSTLNKPDTYAVDFYAEGATNPVQSPSVAASALTVIPGTTPQDYEITFAQLTSYPVGQVFTVKIRAVNAAGSGDASPASDPFGKAGRPAPTSKPRVVP